MAFNFNWSPLIADTSRARDMLTTALNKSPKPPIIVDDILVTELNLGSVPPELEILEIGDLAEDRFRGIFKMCYAGDAFLTLKTRVQANPLNTYLSEKPTFASPQPLAASSGLTIPLQITLSDIRLSGFVILVFSRQKGITLVFRNDPLESLKVSSTFDSIPFVRDYLQKEIEGQLRVLFMEDLPAIIHRLSLRLWVPEHQAEANSNGLEDARGFDKPMDFLSSRRPRDPFGHASDDSELSLDNTTETHASFSQKNLIRLAALTDSHRTLSLFTPPIRDAVFRAWASAAERGENKVNHTPGPGFTFASLSRCHSSATNLSESLYSYAESGTSAIPSSRPSLLTFNSAHSGFTSSTSRSRTHQSRKRKTRIVDLRRKPQGKDSESISSRPSTPSSYVPASEAPPPSASDEREDELVTPPSTPEKKDKGYSPHVRVVSNPPELVIPQPMLASSPWTPQGLPDIPNDDSTCPAKLEDTILSGSQPQGKRQESKPVHASLLQRRQLHRYPSEKAPASGFNHFATHSGGILEQAWMVKMATEIARKVAAEKAGSESGGGFWDSDEGRDIPPPPAYAA